MADVGGGGSVRRGAHTGLIGEKAPLDAVVLIFIGAGMEINMVWNLADVLMGVMALINLPVIVILSRPALAALKDYVTQRKAGKDPVFRAADIGLAGKTECWQ